jgi:hypothetical protein
MADIINLRLERKPKRRADSNAKAAENRIRHGQTKAETMTAKQSWELQVKRLDGHRREPDPPERSD